METCLASCEGAGGQLRAGSDIIVCAGALYFHTLCWRPVERAFHHLALCNHCITKTLFINSQQHKSALIVLCCARSCMCWLHRVCKHGCEQYGNTPEVTCVQLAMYSEQATTHSSSVTNDRSECTALPTAAVFVSLVAVVAVPMRASSPLPSSATAPSTTVCTLVASQAAISESVIAPARTS